MKLWLNSIAQIVGGTLIGDDAIVTSVSIDSRTIKKGALYVPIMGAAFDGHQFIGSAHDNGAVCSLSQMNVPQTHILVDSTLVAFQSLARYYREQFDIPVVGITGSVGKTTTKDMVFAVLSTQYNTLRTQGNLNNQTGVPQVLLSLNCQHEAAIVEMGTNHFGEIDTLSSMVEPTICLFTNIGDAHIEYFGSREGILRGKTEMLKHKRAGGMVIVNGDDPLLCTIDSDRKFGFSEGCDVRATNVIDRGIDGSTFTATIGNESVVINVKVAGRHMITNALAAIAVGDALNISLDKMKAGIESFVPSAGRAQVIRTPHHTIVNDAYNANPTSMRAAIDALKGAKGRRVAILGDMGELGKDELRYHREIAQYALDSGIDLLILVGKLFCSLNIPSALCYLDKDTLKNDLSKLLCQGDTVLVKASHSQGLDKLVEHIN
ncbi:MAG: UDP-N-acetylmuramoyl-tripeptide--D-alanyl-D-alanine ligase [Eubacteriales bacterium]|nr:UDP-N-acetylmuramoyl-tripeptide--D-alanyl-D-alanine ligase [Eubacteriales bacterium]